MLAFCGSRGPHQRCKLQGQEHRRAVLAAGGGTCGSGQPAANHAGRGGDDKDAGVLSGGGLHRVYCCAACVEGTVLATAS